MKKQFFNYATHNLCNTLPVFKTDHRIKEMQMKRNFFNSQEISFD
jgi:hypothetical protein